MDTSLFIARLIGPLLLMVGIAVLVNQANVRQMATDFLESRALIYLTGVLTLFAGLVIINTHNIWQGRPVIITIFGWLCVIGGAFRVVFPERVRAMGETMLQKPWFLTAGGVVQLVAGLWLSYAGYIA